MKRFEIGEHVRFAMLYGGSVNAEVIAKSETTVTLREMWIAEDTGEDVSADSEYKLEIDEEVQAERIETWEYRGEHGYVYATTEIKEEKKMTLPKVENNDVVRFEMGGIVYRQKDAKGTYCYKGGQRIAYKKFEEIYAEYRKTDAYKAEQEAKEEKPAKAKKPSKPRTVAAFEQEIDGQQVRLTEKQVNFIKQMPNDDFYENGLESALWIDVYCDTVADTFNPMAVGAMVSTLREKNLIRVMIQKMNGKKCKYMEFTELGKQVAKELGL